MVDLHLEGYPGPLRQRSHHRQHLAYRRPQLEFLVLQLQPARLDLAEVEHVVDKAEQMAAAGVDVLQALLLLLGAHLARQVVLEDLAEAEDGVERRTQLVAHVGQELALQPAVLLDLGVGHLQLVLLQGNLLQLALGRGVQRGVVETDGCLVGDHPHQRLLQIGERLDPLPAQAEGTHHPVGRLERHDQDTAR